MTHPTQEKTMPEYQDEEFPGMLDALAEIADEQGHHVKAETLRLASKRMEDMMDRALLADVREARLRESLSHLVARSCDISTGISIQNERKAYGPIDGPIVSNFRAAIRCARITLTPPPAQCGTPESDL